MEAKGNQVPGDDGSAMVISGKQLVFSTGKQHIYMDFIIRLRHNSGIPKLCRKKVYVKVEMIKKGTRK